MLNTVVTVSNSNGFLFKVNINTFAVRTSFSVDFTLEKVIAIDYVLAQLPFDEITHVFIVVSGPVLVRWLREINPAVGSENLLDHFFTKLIPYNVLEAFVETVVRWIDLRKIESVYLFSIKFDDP
jgi:hypothetical protein